MKKCHGLWPLMGDELQTGNYPDGYRVEILEMG